MKTLEPIDSRYSIAKEYSAPASEFEVQAYLYNALMKKGHDVRGEVAWFDPDLRVHCRFDLVIYKETKPHRILEVKSAPRKYIKTPLEDTRQGRRYRLFGVPVTFVYGMADAKQFLETL